MVIENGNIRLRLVEEEDASFIYELRSDSVLSRFLTPTPGDLEAQIKWIKNYKLREKQNLEYYFIATKLDGERLGVTRIYNIEERCFEIGSWLFKMGAPDGAAIKTDLLVRDFGFNRNINFTHCKFSVRKDNKSVLKYHLAFKPEKISETQIDVFFSLSKDSFYKVNSKFLNNL